MARDDIKRALELIAGEIVSQAKSELAELGGQYRALGEAYAEQAMAIVRKAAVGTISRSDASAALASLGYATRLTLLSGFFVGRRRAKAKAIDVATTALSAGLKALIPLIL